MLVLAIESATETAGVGIADEAGVIATATLERGRRHAESLVPAISELAARAGVALKEFEAIAVDIGPGLFTGLRVGIATAKAMSFALSIPLIPCTSLQVLARAAFESSPPVGLDIVTVVDARRGEVFWSRYTVAESGPDAVQEEEVSAPEELAELISGDFGAKDLAADGIGADDLVLRGPVPIGAARRTLLVGDGAHRYRKTFESVAGVFVLGQQFSAPPVSVLAAIGVSGALLGLGVSGDQLLPRYLRDADAKINWESRSLPGQP